LPLRIMGSQVTGWWFGDPIPNPAKKNQGQTPEHRRIP